MTAPSSLYIGLMSGTSLDGVDGVLADFADVAHSGAIRTIAAGFVPFDFDLRADLMALQCSGANEIEREAIAANRIAHVYSACVAQLLPAASGPVRAIAAHGQTVRHRPELGFTRQTINPALLAELTGIDVVADFRSRDVAAGGQGAPLVPAYHAAQFGQPGQTRVVVNIGGIGNISVLHADGRVTGFDTGPGNVLMDGWIARHQGQQYDADGAWAATGKPDPALLAAMLGEPYFALAAPKSTGRDLFHLDWLDAMLARCTALPAADVQASLMQLTAVSIARAIGTEARQVDAVYVCGGGTYNGALMRALQAEMKGSAIVASTATLGVAPNRVEALAFAWLAYRFHHRQAGNLPAVTGAKGSRILGALYPA
ncbi:anhydro-N-acetylmuramic acid kinase [Massilia psychrophila]|uniref:Anhydro-N-acetylmuramic acid kinase n=1 Tax=Massilia psychrophila TaxID=1603353 RepID=A0A2G8T228_9BURK|nr:anhydro-N-acetylmuramic acid kinase [Massilia psychrophila]PIL40110.1 anhydro-N-acetylmuramic acid kinase [Massilia psychrophila]GGE70218.1 anhydro-N-acetylmuramic acid kinase [Massilia psychrophila]